MSPLKPINTLRSLGLQSRIRIKNTPPTTIRRTLTVTSKNAPSLTPRESTSTPSLHLPPTSRTSSRPSQHTPPSAPPQDISFSALVTSMTNHLTTNATPHLPTLTNLLRSYNPPSSSYSSQTPDWTPYAHANPKKQYTRNLIASVPGIFNLLILVWTPGMRSPVHDHADSHCLMKVLRGRVRERVFEMPKGENSAESEGGLREISRRTFEEGKVTYISDRLGLHEVANPDEGVYAVSLHLYTPPNAAEHGCHVYDEVTGEKKHVVQSAYDSVRGVVGASE